MFLASLSKCVTYRAASYGVGALAYIAKTSQKDLGSLFGLEAVSFTPALFHYLSLEMEFYPPKGNYGPRLGISLLTE